MGGMKGGSTSGGLTTEGKDYAVSILGTQMAQEKGKRFTVYIVLVAVGEVSWVVLRRYSQFHTLHAMLRRTLGSRLMREAQRAFPRKRMMNNLSPTSVDQRHMQLQQYMNALLDLPEVRSCSAFVTFVEKDAKDAVHYSDLIEAFVASLAALHASEGESGHADAGATPSLEGVSEGPGRLRKRAVPGKPDVHAIVERGTERIAAGDFTRSDLLIAGKLLKLHGKNHWVERYFQLRSNVLYKYASQRDQHPKGSYTLVRNARVRALTPDEAKALRRAKDLFCFRIEEDSGDVRVFATTAADVRDRWIHCLKRGLSIFGDDSQLSDLPSLPAPSPKLGDEHPSLVNFSKDPIKTGPPESATEKRSDGGIRRSDVTEIVFRALAEVAHQPADLMQVRALARSVAARIEAQTPPPEPLVTFQFNLLFLAVYAVHDAQAAVRILRTLLGSLPRRNYAALYLLFLYLHRNRGLYVAGKSESASEAVVTERLARMFGAGLVTGADAAMASPQYEHNAATNVARMLLDHFDELFEAVDAAELAAHIDVLPSASLNSSLRLALTGDPASSSPAHALKNRSKTVETGLDLRLSSSGAAKKRLLQPADTTDALEERSLTARPASISKSLSEYNSRFVDQDVLIVDDYHLEAMESSDSENDDENLDIVAEDEAEILPESAASSEDRREDGVSGTETATAHPTATSGGVQKPKKKKKGTGIKKKKSGGDAGSTASTTLEKKGKKGSGASGKKKGVGKRQSSSRRLAQHEAQDDRPPAPEEKRALLFKSIVLSADVSPGEVPSDLFAENEADSSDLDDEDDVPITPREAQSALRTPRTAEPTAAVVPSQPPPMPSSSSIPQTKDAREMGVEATFIGPRSAVARFAEFSKRISERRTELHHPVTHLSSTLNNPESTTPPEMNSLASQTS